MKPMPSSVAGIRTSLRIRAIWGSDSRAARASSGPGAETAVAAVLDEPGQQLAYPGVVVHHQDGRAGGGAHVRPAPLLPGDEALLLQPGQHLAHRQRGDAELRR